MSLLTIETPLGRFRMANRNDVLRGNREDGWLFECPGCGQWAYLDDDQWHGRVSVDHAADGCTGGYHETHDYDAALSAALDDRVRQR